MDKQKAIVSEFYSECLTVNDRSDPAIVMGRILADDFQSLGSVEKKTKAALIGQVKAFWKLIPDLKWDVQEMVIEGDKVVVRSVASGTPNGDFMGVPTNGTKTFSIMTIDIHKVVEGRLASVHHIEDWPTALKQLRS